MRSAVSCPRPAARHRRAALTCLVPALLAGAGPGASSDGSAEDALGISSITYMDVVYQPTQTVKVWRGLKASLRVDGTPIATALDVVVLLPDGQTPAPLITVSKGAAGPTTVFVTIDAAPIAQMGEYIVRFVYAAAVGTPDQFRIRLYDRGTVNSISVTPEWPKVAEEIKATVTGAGLEWAKLDMAMLPALGLSGYQVVSRSATQLVFTVKAAQPGDGQFESFMFYDENVGATQVGLPASYLGNARATFPVSPNPIITGVSPQVVADNGVVTLTGSNFMVNGWTPTVRLNMPTSWSEPVTVVNASTLRFNARPAMSAQDLAIRYKPASGSGYVDVPIPQKIHVNAAPVVTEAGTALWGTAPPACSAPPCSTSGDTRVFGVRTGETHTVGGFYLMSPPGGTVTVRLGSTRLNVVSVMSNQIRFTVPALRSVTGGHIFVETSGGTATSPRAVNYNPAPSNLVLLRKDGPETSSTAPWVPVTDGRLERDRNYRISGNNLHFMVDGFPATDTAVRPKLGQGSVQFLPLSFIGNDISFHVPTTQPLGGVTLSYGHWGGSSPLGTFQIVDNKALAKVHRLRVASSGTVWYDDASLQGSLDARTLQGGTNRTVSVSVRAFTENGELQPLYVTSTDAAIVPGTPSPWTPASLSGGENGAVNTATSPYPAASVTLQVQQVPQDREVMLRFSVGPSPNAGAIAEVPVLVRGAQAPAPRELTVDSAAVWGGQPVKGNLQLEFAPVFPVAVPLSTSDASAAQVPASITMSGMSTFIPVVTSAVNKVMNVTITAGTGSTAQSTTLAVHPAPVVQSLTAPTNSLPAGQAVRVTVSLDKPATRSTVVTLTTGNPALLSIPPSVPLAAGQTSVTFRAQAGPVPVVTSVWIDAKAGTSTRRLELRITP